MDFVEARKPAGSRFVKDKTRRESFFHQTFRATREEMERSDIGAPSKIAQQNPIRRKTGIWGKLGPAARQREAAPAESPGGETKAAGLSGSAACQL